MHTLTDDPDTLTYISNMDELNAYLLHCVEQATLRLCRNMEAAGMTREQTNEALAAVVPHANAWMRKQRCLFKQLINDHTDAPACTVH
jgi:hypothetical protein